MGAWRMSRHEFLFSCIFRARNIHWFLSFQFLCQFFSSSHGNMSTTKMVDHSLESLFWIRKDDMLTKYRIGAQIKDKDANKFICYVFFKLFPKFEIVYIIHYPNGGMSIKLWTFFTFGMFFWWLPWERFFLI